MAENIIIGSRPCCVGRELTHRNNPSEVCQQPGLNELHYEDDGTGSPATFYVCDNHIRELAPSMQKEEDYTAETDMCAAGRSLYGQWSTDWSEPCPQPGTDIVHMGTDSGVIKLNLCLHHLSQLPVEFLM